MGQGQSLQIGGFSSEEDLVDAIAQAYTKDPERAERIIREVERLNQPAAKSVDHGKVRKEVPDLSHHIINFY